MQPMDSRNRRKQAPVINITPLVDVLLILVALLMLTLPLQVKKLPVELPQTALGGTPTPQKALTVAINKDGELLLGASVTPLSEVLPKVTETTTVELAIDEAVPYGTIAEVASAVQSRNPKEIVFLTR